MVFFVFCDSIDFYLKLEENRWRWLLIKIVINVKFKDVCIIGMVVCKNWYIIMVNECKFYNVCWMYCVKLSFDFFLIRYWILLELYRICIFLELNFLINVRCFECWLWGFIRFFFLFCDRILLYGCILRCWVFLKMLLCVVFVRILS